MRGGLIHAWINAVSVFVPRVERERWRWEWHADMDAMGAGSASTGVLFRAALGIAWAALTFRFEGASVDGWMRETLYAIRGLLMRPAFTAVAVQTLGLGIGANTAIFSVVNGVILEPLRYPESEQLVMITSSFPTMGFEDFWISPPEYMQVSENTTSFSTIGSYVTSETSIGGDEQPERIESAFVDRQLFEALGVTPMMGRTFSEEEDLVGGPPVIVLSYEMWQRSFGGDRDILGRSIEVDGASTDVIGVMPEGFDIDDSQIQAWLPMQLDWSNRQNFGSHFLYLVGRLRPGVTLETAENEVNDLVNRWDDVIGSGHLDPETHPLHLKALQEEVVGDVRPALMVLLGAVGFVLLIACANVANLLLARAEDRQKEVAVRVAMGAGRGRLLRQFLTEGLVLSVVGGALGVAVAAFSLKLLQAASPGDVPRLAEVQLDGMVLGFTTLIAVGTGIFFGLAPTRHVSFGGLAGALRDGGTRSTSSGGQLRLRSLLVVSEIALALVLTVGAGLMVRSFTALTSVEPGFDPDGLLTFELYPPASAYPDGEARLAFMNRVLDELKAQPGVTSAAAMSGLPPVRRLNANDTEFEGYVRTDDSPPQNVDYYQTISSDYLATMGIQVVDGRGFQPSDDAGAVPVALVNQALARKFYPNESPIGRRIRTGQNAPWLEVVGVVADVKQGGLDIPAGTELYFHYPQALAGGGTPRTMNFVASTGGDPAALGPTARSVVWSIDGTLPVSNLRSMEDVMGDAMARARFLTSLLAGFAALALLLAAVGTYGVMSYAVAQRSREMGIRIAMGAEASAVRRLVLVQGLRVAVIGLVVGFAGAWSLTGILESMLFGIDARDPVSFASGPILLSLVAVLACLIPSHRATRVDPVKVLREE